MFISFNCNINCKGYCNGCTKKKTHTHVIVFAHCMSKTCEDLGNGTNVYFCYVKIALTTGTETKNARNFCKHEDVVLIKHFFL